MEHSEQERLATYYAGLSDHDVLRAYSSGPDGFREPWIWELVGREYSRRVEAGTLRSGQFAGSLAVAGWVLEHLGASFPNWALTVEQPPPEGLEWSVTIPEQPGLVFEVNLNLQNKDELHLVAGGLWVSWFPCTDPTVADAYLDAVAGLLSGRYRILQHRHRDQVVGAELQRPVAEGWERITHCWYAPPITGVWSPWAEKTVTVLQNAPPQRAGQT